MYEAGFAVRRAIRCLVVVVVILGTSIISNDARAQSGPDVFFSKGGWSGFVLRREGRIYGCAVATAVSTKLRFHLVVFDGKWKIVLDRPSEFGQPPGFARDRQWKMDILVDALPIHSGTAIVDKTGLAVLEPELNPAMLRSLGRGKTLEVVTDRGRFQYGLGGSADAIEAALSCERYLASNSRPHVQQSSPANAGPSVSPNEPSWASGTGFFVSENGDIVTNHHVIKGCKSITAGLAGTLMQSVYLAASDPRNDLALLRSTMRPAKVPALRSGVRTGEAVAVYGFPLAGILPSTGNFTLGNITATSGLQDDSRHLQVSAAVQQGNSGGPLLDHSGNVVGVVVGKLNSIAAGRALGDIPQNVNFAIKTASLVSFLDANTQRTSSPIMTSTITAPDLADAAKLFTVFIVCQR